MSVEAIDLFPENVEALTRLAEAFSLPVFCNEAISHFENWRGFLAESARALRPGGRLLIADWQNGANPWMRWMTYRSGSAPIALCSGAEMAIWMAMSRRYSIAEARDAFARIVHQVERGEPVELTRRGRTVAVVMSVEEYRRSRGTFPSFWEECRKFRDAYEVAGLDLSPEIFEDTRDSSPGRRVRL